MTNDLIERMLGHRTRLVQEEPAQWHQAEDQMLEHYLTQSTAMDGYAVAQTVMARGWLVVGLCGLAPAFISGNPSPERIA